MKKLIILPFIVLTIFTEAYSLNNPESIVYYPHWKNYLVANLGFMDEVSKGHDPGHIALLFKGQILAGLETNTKPAAFDNPKGISLEGDSIYFVNYMHFWCVRLPDLKVEYAKKMTDYKVTPALIDQYKIGNTVYITDNANNTIFKIDLEKDTIINLNFGDRIKAPRCITFDKTLNKLIFVTHEKNSRIFSLDPANDSLELITTTNIRNMYGITKDKEGIYYITSWGDSLIGNSKVYKYPSGLKSNPVVFLDSLTRATSIYYNELLDEIAVPYFRMIKLTNGVPAYATYSDKDLIVLPLSKVPLPKPEAPKLIYPSDNQAALETQPEFKWNEVDNTIYYQLEVSDSAHFPKRYTSYKEAVENYYQMYYYIMTEMKENSKYYWRVAAYNRSGLSEYSEVRTFTTGVKQMVAPVADTINKDLVPVPVQPIFSWSSIGADSYALQVYQEKNGFEKKADNPEFYPDVLNPDYSYEGIKDTVFSMPDKLKEGTDYYWRVRGIKGDKFSLWSKLMYIGTEGVNDVAYSADNRKLIVFNEYGGNNSGINISLDYETCIDIMLINPVSLESQTVFSSNVPQSEYSAVISYNGLPSGIYFVVARTDRETFYRKISIVK